MFSESRTLVRYLARARLGAVMVAESRAAVCVDLPGAAPELWFPRARQTVEPCGLIAKPAKNSPNRRSESLDPQSKEEFGPCCITDTSLTCAVRSKGFAEGNRD